MYTLEKPHPGLTIGFAAVLVALGVGGTFWHPPTAVMAVLALGGLVVQLVLADRDRRRRPLADDTCGLDRRRP